MTTKTKWQKTAEQVLMSAPLTYNNRTSWVETVWEALHAYREGDNAVSDETWDDLCTAMAWIEEALGFIEVWRYDRS